MVTDFLLGILFGGLNSLLSLLPSWSLPAPPDAREGTNTMVQALTTVASIVPLQQVVIATSAAVALVLLLYAWDFLVWVYHQFWGSS